ncbi:MAG: Prespore specific transcriptional activator RsfA [Candidatus Carbobacillus altaicus]|uniref:Prespore specific transcriptional activator RsfA n=1 Tax=Candidatus Carbonibacillus altaicus TaxID=2163959 RepID=A0A2R6Y1E1_9BACL|nr:MAG: Prespore specific transcriptional activator RsfA [Candidatus Carbobacillus altaicus]
MQAREEKKRGRPPRRSPDLHSSWDPTHEHVEEKVVVDAVDKEKTAKNMLREAAMDALEEMETSTRYPSQIVDDETQAADFFGETSVDKTGDGALPATRSSRSKNSRGALEKTWTIPSDQGDALRIRRYDSWREDEDELLASLVLKHVAGGGTQLEAFSEAAGLLGRTASACGFRWNKALRSRYEKELTEAKNRRREVRKKKRQVASQVERERKSDMLQLGSLWVLTLELEKTLQRLKEEIRQMKKKQLEDIGHH